MRHITTLFMMLALVLGTFASLTAQNMTAKEQRKLTRQERKIAQQKVKEELYQDAVRALENNTFVLEANRLIFKRGRSANVSSIKTDKNGSVIYSFYVQGVSISAYVTISLSPSSNNVSARISPSFNSNTLTMMGKLLPQEKASIFEGIKR